MDTDAKVYSESPESSESSDEGFQAHMRTVDHLKITGCSIDRAAAEKLCRLFPCLCNPVGPDDRPRTLQLEQCELGEGVASSLFSCMRLECLAIVDCRLPDPPPYTPSLAPLLSSISSMGDTLQTLILYCHSRKEFDEIPRKEKFDSRMKGHSRGTLFRPLEDLRHLRGLHLGWIASKAAAHDPEAVRDLLCKLPLHSLTLSSLEACSVVPPFVKRVCFDIGLWIAPDARGRGKIELDGVVHRIKGTQEPKVRDDWRPLHGKKKVVHLFTWLSNTQSFF
ncbi:hypothetical protein DUNSADRAFT_13285 [Dunaliella salina]|uniref:Uncharacterized protein n=1 Tax=Dunaliella salina TaxID=3046 RepID=A0ABQ7G9S2_DUNSA|nr:hypothetical protein DUNSADRAFT_13285 [Dunaliella salina]|eukprot:KAF5831346.1 hypothetical protein DUNSADRAFT_13285 [Dunaliella salina]